MVKKVEWFTHEKLEAKVVPLEYLNFSHAFVGKPYPHAPVPTPVLVSVLVRAWGRQHIARFFLNWAML